MEASTFVIFGASQKDRLNHSWTAHYDSMVKGRFSLDDGRWFFKVGRMARQLRLEYEGGIYHVMNRGDRREPIFKDDRDREIFLETLSQAAEKTGWQVHTYVFNLPAANRGRRR